MPFCKIRLNAILSTEGADWIYLANMSAAYCVWNLEILRNKVPDLNELTDEVCGSQSVVFEQAASMSPGYLLEMQILAPILSYWVRNIREKGPSLCFNKSARGVWSRLKFEVMAPWERGKSNDNYNSLRWVLWSRSIQGVRGTQEGAVNSGFIEVLGHKLNHKG